MAVKSQRYGLLGYHSVAWACAKRLRISNLLEYHVLHSKQARMAQAPQPATKSSSFGHMRRQRRIGAQEHMHVNPKGQMRFPARPHRLWKNLHHVSAA